MSKRGDTELVSNRKAFHDYEIMETFEAGIVLVGTEVKSLRNHEASLQDAYILVSDHAAILKNASIAPYRFGNLFNHEERRERKLLLHRREIQKLKALSQEKGIALIPLAIYLKNGKIKVKIGCGRGKKMYDKRAALRDREQARAVDRALKGE